MCCRLGWIDSEWNDKENEDIKKPSKQFLLFTIDTFCDKKVVAIHHSRPQWSSFLHVLREHSALSITSLCFKNKSKKNSWNSIAPSILEKEARRQTSALKVIMSLLWNIVELLLGTSNFALHRKAYLLSRITIWSFWRCHRFDLLALSLQ